MIRKLEHIGVMVTDIERSIKFYTEHLGLEVDERLSLGETQLIFLSYPGSRDVQIELIGPARSDFHQDGRVNHIAFTVENIEEDVERLLKAGVKMRDTEAKNPLPGLKIAFFEGPDGEILELFQREKE